MRGISDKTVTPATIVLASGNSGKLREINAMLEPYAVNVRGQHEFGLESVDETGETFIENALIKARHAALATGLPAIADDSGLVVDALGGAPGIHSARYAGVPSNAARNVEKLLAEMKDVDTGARVARFVCAIVWLRSPADPWPRIGLGEWPGQIATEARGKGGFGYDPVFVPDGPGGNGRTAAELDRDEKNSVSHRARALSALTAHFESR